MLPAAQTILMKFAIVRQEEQQGGHCCLLTRHTTLAMSSLYFLEVKAGSCISSIGHMFAMAARKCLCLLCVRSRQGPTGFSNFSDIFTMQGLVAVKRVCFVLLLSYANRLGMLAGVAEMAEDLFKTLRPSIEECMHSSRKLVLVGHSLGETSFTFLFSITSCPASSSVAQDAPTILWLESGKFRSDNSVEHRASSWLVLATEFAIAHC